MKPEMLPPPPTHAPPWTDTAEVQGNEVAQAENRPQVRDFGLNAQCVGPGIPEYPGEAPALAGDPVLRPAPPKWEFQLAGEGTPLAGVLQCSLELPPAACQGSGQHCTLRFMTEVSRSLEADGKSKLGGPSRSLALGWLCLQPSGLPHWPGPRAGMGASGVSPSPLPSLSLPVGSLTPGVEVKSWVLEATYLHQLHQTCW